MTLTLLVLEGVVFVGECRTCALITMVLLGLGGVSVGERVDVLTVVLVTGDVFVDVGLGLSI